MKKSDLEHRIHTKKLSERRYEDEWAKDHSYESYFEFLDLTRKCNVDHIFIMDGAVNQIANRYAQQYKDRVAELEKMIKYKH